VPDERDELIARVVDELRVLPVVKPGVAAEVLSRIDAARTAGVVDGPASDRPLRLTARPRRSMSIAAAVMFAVAASLVGFLVRGLVPSRTGPAMVANAPTVRSPAIDSPRVQVATVARVPDEDAAVPFEFVLAARRASRVTLVGDFNHWDGARTPMQHDVGSGVWSITLSLTPGRHAYAFVVDDSVWTLDPRTPRRIDPDFGTPQSVVLVAPQ
jgi:hypothetical protein